MAQAAGSSVLNTHHRPTSQIESGTLPAEATATPDAVQISLISWRGLGFPRRRALHRDVIVDDQRHLAQGSSPRTSMAWLPAKFPLRRLPNSYCLPSSKGSLAQNRVFLFRAKFSPEIEKTENGSHLADVEATRQNVCGNKDLGSAVAELSNNSVAVLVQHVALDGSDLDVQRARQRVKIPISPRCHIPPKLQTKISVSTGASHQMVANRHPIQG